MLRRSRVVLGGEGLLPWADWEMVKKMEGTRTGSETRGSSLSRSFPVQNPGIARSVVPVHAI